MYLPRKKDKEVVVVMATDRGEPSSTEPRLLRLLGPGRPRGHPGSAALASPGKDHKPPNLRKLLGAPTFKGRNSICFKTYFLKRDNKMHISTFLSLQTEQSENLLRGADVV